MGGEPEDDVPERTAVADHTGVTGTTVAAEAAVLAARRYQPLDEIARGGAGRIVRARDLAFDRIVAIKEPLDRIHGGERLRAEATILASLQHPSIVPVYDAGTRLDGVPFFAMKLIDGRSLREVIRDAPALEQRLALIPQVVAVAEAMAYAHARAVIHRDLKPANVLIGPFGETIVIDWGLAKVMGAEQITADGRGRGRAVPSVPRVATTTTTGDVMGTPAYMAPEQARGERVDARADVYALGAILYHVLAGAAPYAGHSGRDIMQTVLLGAPDPIAELQPRVPADLVAIVTKAMARDAGERYPSAAQLADDLVRFQTGRLVSARRYSPIARSRRWLRNHRGVVAAIGLAAVSAGAATVLRSGPTASPREEPCSLAAQRAHLDGVWDRGDRASAVRAAFLASGRPYAADTFDRVAGRLDGYGDAWATARVEVCAATHVRGEQSEALLDLRMACLDRRLGEVGALVDVFARGSSAAVLDKAVEATAKLAPLAACDDVDALQAVVAPPVDPDTRARVDALRAELAGARALEQTGQYAAGLAAAQAVASAATPIGYAPLLAEALAERAYLEDRTGDSKTAETTLVAALLAAADARDDVLAVHDWADLLYVIGYQLGRPDEALQLRPAAEASVRRAGHAPEAEARLWNNLGMVHLAKGAYADARPLIERALAMMEQTLGADDPRVAGPLSALAWALSAEGDYDGARKHQERALAIFERALGPDHPLVALALGNLAETLRIQDHLGEARRANVRALAIRENALGPDHPSVANTLHNLAIIERAEKDLDGARAHFERALAIREQALGAEHRDVADTLIGLGNVRQAQGAIAEARQLFERALAIQDKTLGPDHPQLAYSLTNLAKLAEQEGRHEEARRDHARALALAEKGLGPDHPELAYHLAGLATALLSLGRHADAQVAAERALAIREARKEPVPLIAQTRFLLARTLWPVARERARARTLAGQAREVLAADGEPEVLATVDAWLRTH